MGMNLSKYCGKMFTSRKKSHSIVSKSVAVNSIWLVLFIFVVVNDTKEA